jgi:hypothetical protein
MKLNNILGFMLFSISCISTSIAQSADFKGCFLVKPFTDKKGIIHEDRHEIFLKTKSGTFFIKDCDKILPPATTLHKKKVVLRGKLQTGGIDDCSIEEEIQGRGGVFIDIENFVLEK